MISENDLIEMERDARRIGSANCWTGSGGKLASIIVRLVSELRGNSIERTPGTMDDLELLNPDALLAEGFEDALIGYTQNFHHATVAVYDYGACVRVLVERDGMSIEEAEEFLSFNTLDADFGENGPLFVELFAR